MSSPQIGSRTRYATPPMYTNVPSLPLTIVPIANRTTTGARDDAEPSQARQPRPGQQAGARRSTTDDDERDRLDRVRTRCRRRIVDRHHAGDEQQLRDAPHGARQPAARLRDQRQRRRRQPTELPEGEHEERDRGGHDDQREVVDRPERLADPEEETDRDERHRGPPTPTTHPAMDARRTMSRVLAHGGGSRSGAAGRSFEGERHRRGNLA